MQIGQLDRRITFQHATTVKDSSGQDIKTWVPFSPTVIRSASIKPLQGREVFEARTVTAETPLSIVVRYDSDTNSIDPELHRIVENESGDVYAIHSKSDYRLEHRWIEFWCSKGMKDQQ